MSILLNNRILSSGQIQDCLNVITNVSYRLASAPEWEPGGVPKTDPLEGESKVALERTLVKACERMDAILSDDSRWQIPKLDAQDLLAVNLSQNVEINRQQMLQAQMQTEIMKRQIQSGATLAQLFRQEPDDAAPQQEQQTEQPAPPAPKARRRGKK